MEDMDAPLKKVGSAGRRYNPREDGRDLIEDRGAVEDRALSDDDRIEMFRQTLFNDVLPDLPDVPGYHVCWLSTSHQSDTIPRRIRLGYEPIKASELPGFEHATVKTGEYAGFIGINEMLAFKLPMTLYQAYMQEAHHAEPARQESMIASQAEQLREQARRDGGEIMEGDGMAEMRRSAPSRGKFSN